jgi:hypothetical protein
MGVEEKGASSPSISVTRRHVPSEFCKGIVQRRISRQRERKHFGDLGARMEAVKAVNRERRRANYLFIMTCDLRAQHHVENFQKIIRKRETVYYVYLFLLIKHYF